MLKFPYSIISILCHLPCKAPSSNAGFSIPFPGGGKGAIVGDMNFYKGAEQKEESLFMHKEIRLMVSIPLLPPRFPIVHHRTLAPALSGHHDIYLHTGRLYLLTYREALPYLTC